MKNIIRYLSFILAVFFFSCQEKQADNPCLKITKEKDSLLNLKLVNDKLPLLQFYNILNKEKGKPIDSILINDYKSIIGKDSLIDLYVWDRIHTINQIVTETDVYLAFKGTYLLKPNHNKKYSKITKVEIINDSCYLYKSDRFILKEAFNLINSSDSYVKGKIKIKNYKLMLLDFSSKVIILDDNSCMDCEQLQFYKIN